MGAGSGLTHVEMRQLGSGSTESRREADAVPSQGVPFAYSGFAVGGPRERRIWRRSGGVAGSRRGRESRVVERRMVNFPSPGEATAPGGVRSAYGPERHAGLTAVNE